MYTVFLASLFLIAAGTVALTLLLKVRALKAAQLNVPVNLTADRYRPMLRLLSDSDFAAVSRNPELQKKMRSGRRDLFRSYLRCLSRDYAGLLAGLREVITLSGSDRPDLMRAIARNRVLFAWAICKIEFRLALHITGVDSEIEKLVGAVDVLRDQVRILSTAPAAV